MNKFTLVAMKDELFSTIFAINSMYMDITFFFLLSMSILRVLKFHQSFAPLSFQQVYKFQKLKVSFQAIKKEGIKRLKASPLCVSQ